MSSAENLKRCRKDNDYISELPDTVLCRILSFLLTKDAVKTSILSRRWKYLWTKVPALDFSQASLLPVYYSSLDMDQKICFKSFVDRVLFHNEVSYVQRFCLSLHNADNFSVNAWLNAGARREIRELNISLRCPLDARTSLPPRLLSNEKLVVLKLKGHLIPSFLLSFQYSNLETIYFENLKFPDDAFMTRLLLSCPILNELEIMNCYGLPEVQYAESLTLKSLAIEQEVDGSESTNFFISIPNVRYLRLCGTLLQYDLANKYSPIEADLDVVYDDHIADNGHAQALLKKVSGVQILRIASDCFIFESKLPFFSNLTKLDQEADNVMCELLNCAPKLKSVVIRNVNYENPFYPESAPKNLPCLESVEFRWISDNDEDIEVVAYFLKSASALKEMTVRDSPFLGISFYKKLLSLPRSSVVCQANVI